MTIPVKVEDYTNYGAVPAIILGYCRQHPKRTLLQYVEELKMSPEAIRRHLQNLESIGVVERVYVADGIGRPKLIGVKVL